MKKINLILTIVLSIAVYGNAQNLVPNYSFETYSVCPTGPSLITSWYSPNGSTPDYFNSCATNVNYNVPSNSFGFQNAHTGNAYIGIVCYVSWSANGREYVQTKLMDTLLANEIYCVSFYVSPADLAQWGCNKIGGYFSSTAVSACGDCLMSYTPQVESTSMISDTSAWVKVSGYFTAVGDEEYLTIGNFRSNANTDTVTINPSVINPEVYFYIDDVSVMLCDDTLNVADKMKDSFIFNVYPNPSNGTVVIKYTFKQNDIASINIYDVTGKLVVEHELNANTNEIELSTNLSNGIYLYQVFVNDKVVKSDKLVVVK